MKPAAAALLQLSATAAGASRHAMRLARVHLLPARVAHARRRFARARPQQAAARSTILLPWQWQHSGGSGGSGGSGSGGSGVGVGSAAQRRLGGGGSSAAPPSSAGAPAARGVALRCALRMGPSASRWAAAAAWSGRAWSQGALLRCAPAHRFHQRRKRLAEGVRRAWCAFVLAVQRFAPHVCERNRTFCGVWV